MSNRLGVSVLIGSVLAAGTLAFFGSSAPTSAVARGSTSPLPQADMVDPRGPLPPNHPPIGGVAALNDAPIVPSEDPASVEWTVPATWRTVPHASSMRLATYGVPRAKGDVDDAEVSVMRAGGTTDANIERWLGQFTDAGKDVREVNRVAGLTVTVVTVAGTYVGGGMSPGSIAAPHPGWALLGAIVEGEGTPYFFKLTGPQSSVRAARPAFDALVASLHPAR